MAELTEKDRAFYEKQSDERKARLIFLEKLTSRVASCAEEGYKILQKVENQSPAMQKKIKNFLKKYDDLEKEIKKIESET